MKAKTKKLLWLLPLGVAGAGLTLTAVLHPTTRAETSWDNMDNQLRTRRYRASLDKVRETLEALIPTLRCYGAHWRLIESKTYDAGTPHASVIIRVEVPVTVFVDDLTITMREEGDAVLLDANSEARTKGKSDLGENRRHLIQLLSALDGKFAGPA
jgi:hypothetical protein